MGAAGQALDTFGNEKLGPAMAGTAATLNSFSEHQLAPAVQEVSEVLNYSGADVLSRTGKYIKENPGTCAITSAAWLLCWFLVSSVDLSYGLYAGVELVLELVSPHLCLVNRSFMECIADPNYVVGSAAAGLQASMGPIAARSGFATLQSAVVGGYGPVLVNGVVRAGSAVLGAAARAAGLGSNRTDSAVSEEEHKEHEDDTEEPREERKGTDVRSMQQDSWDMCNVKVVSPRQKSDLH